MTQIKKLFDSMDQWRHLPNYQLERRADLFFSLYIAEALEDKLGFPVSQQLIPEFPVRIGTIYPNIDINKSYKIDYLALSGDKNKALLVELKTEGMSRRLQQDKYLLASRDAGLKSLLNGVVDIFRATNSKRKYFCLLEDLESIDLLSIPDNVKQCFLNSNLTGVNEASKDIKITSQADDCTIVYIQPNPPEEPLKSCDNIISFADFRKTVNKHDDPLSKRFAKSLKSWADTAAGRRH